MQSMHFEAAVIWGVLYTVSVTGIGLATGHHIAWQFGLMTMAFAFFAHAAQTLPQVTRRMPLMFSAASWLTGAIAGGSLFF